MTNNIILKKIYINDYIIDTKLLNKSIQNLLYNHLSNKVYKNKHIHSKVSKIINIFDSLYKEDNNNNKIFNLSYQPFNQYNTIFNYYKNNFNKNGLFLLLKNKKNYLLIHMILTLKLTNLPIHIYLYLIQ